MFTHISTPSYASKAFKLSIFASALVLAGCATVEPRPFTVQDIQAQAQTDRGQSQTDVEPIKGALSLEEAIARGLKYNLDRRTRMMEEDIAFNQLDVSKFDMLPKLVASAGYSSRSEYAITRAEDSVTGAPSLGHPFISSDKSHTTTDLGLTWNMLDFGLSYYGAKQNADRALIAVERRRKAMHILIQDVRSAFWRTASAQKLRAEVKSSIALAVDALGDARKAEDERLRSPLDSLRYQRQVLENMRLLETIDQELSTAKVELANLINAPLALDLQVIEPTEALSRRMLELPVADLEDVAITHNADLREQFYNTRIAREETHKTILRMFPSLSFNYTLKHDSDKYMVNNSWNEAGAQLSFNLLNLLAAPSQKRLAEAGVALADQRRIATQMAILAQMHIARLQYSNALQQFERSDAIWSIDNRINAHMANREQAQTVSKLDMVANNTAAILSLLRRYQALAQAHAAASRLQATLGMEPEIGSIQDISLHDLQSVIGNAIKHWENGELPISEAEPAKSILAPTPAAGVVLPQSQKLVSW
ncbi:TolC family protein [Rhodoferax sp.]|uniref:TolC family protein n=1 Tax=Rhodoferax sp. TaxID=50421 RepID=UPI00284F2F0D|nr:TolC family protein [Rhodoferax sp.]MDR3368417.1 TolC family protein [Rhodoferax sp.]